MKSIIFAFIIAIIYCSFSANATPLPQTSVTFNAAKSRVHVTVWLSPSCTHCKDYFLEELPKIIALQGFCLELRFLPHLYVLDMAVDVLIWSQGTQKAYENAKFFYEMQSEWLNLSASRDALDDSRRVEDLNNYLVEVKNRMPNDFESIKNYLKPNDPYLYVKMVALKRFRIEHLVQYLPSGIQMVDLNLSLALMNNLPVKDGKVVNFSPAFTSASGQVLPDDILHKGILTFDVANEMLSKAGPPMFKQNAAPAVVKEPTHPKSDKGKVANASKQRVLPASDPQESPRDEHFEDAEGVQHARDEDAEDVQHAPDNGSEMNEDDGEKNDPEEVEPGEKDDPEEGEPGGKNYPEEDEPGEENYPEEIEPGEKNDPEEGEPGGKNYPKKVDKKAQNFLPKKFKKVPVRNNKKNRQRS